MTEEESPINLNSAEEFKEKYTAYVESMNFGERYPGISESGKEDCLRRKRAFLRNGPEIYKVINEILSPDSLTGKKVTLLSGNLNDSPNCFHTIEHVVKLAGAELVKFESPYYESVWIKESFTRDKNLDRERWASINKSDYLFCRAGTVCNVAFFPIVCQYLNEGKGKALFFLDEERLTGQCRDDWELKYLRELKSEGKEIHIITQSIYGHNNIIRFL